MNKRNNTTKKITSIFVLAVISIFLLQTEVKAQGDPEVIQMSGIIVDGDSSYGVPGVHVWIPSAGVGTVSNQVGLFALPTMVGDTVIFSAVGYKKQKFIVPQKKDKGFTVLIDLQTDTTFLPVVEIIL